MQAPHKLLALVTLSNNLLTIVVELGIHYLVVWDCNVTSSPFEVHSTNVTEGGIEDSLFVCKSSTSFLLSCGHVILLLPNCPFQFNRAWILNFLDARDFIVTKTINVNSLMLIEVSTSYITIERDSVILRVFLSFNNIEAICNHI